MNRKELEKRTKVFALKILAFVATLPQTKIGDIVTYQFVKAGTSVGAKYREAKRAESRNDFIHKIAIVEKESAESQYWLELCDDARLGESELRRGYIFSGTVIPKTANAEVSRRRTISATEIKIARLIVSSSAMIR